MSEAIADKQFPYAAGLILTTPDPNAFKLSSVNRFLTGAGDLPEKLDLTPWIPPPKHQGNTASCGPHVASAIIEYHANKSRGIRYPASTQFIYDLRSNAGPGMMVPDLLRIMQTHGTPPEITYPYMDREAKPDGGPCAEVRRPAMDFVSGEWYQVTDVNIARKALNDVGVLLIATPLHRFDSQIWHPDGSGAHYGGHATAIVGYDESGFIVRNSWGPHWGPFSNGHDRMSFTDFDKGMKELAHAGWQCIAIGNASSSRPDPLADPKVVYRCVEITHPNLADIALAVIMCVAIALIVAVKRKT